MKGGKVKWFDRIEWAWGRTGGSSFGSGFRPFQGINFEVKAS